MIKLHHNIFLSVAVVAMLASCSSSADDAVRTDDVPRPITFTPMEISTRAAQTTDSTLTSYGVSCSVYGTTASYTTAAIGSYFYNEEIAAETGRSTHYWPGADYRVSFFAYAPFGNSNLTLSQATTIGRPVYTLTVPSDINQQADFITAEVLDHSGAAITAPVKLAFKHCCTDVRLAVYNRGGDPITVNSISVNGVKYHGSYSGSAWTLDGEANTADSHPFTLTPSTPTTVAPKDTIDFTGNNHHFILLPQTIASGTAFITVNTTIAGMTKDHVYTLPADFTLQQGRSHYLTISLSADYIEVDTGSDITDWGVETKYLTADGTIIDGNMTQPGADGHKDTNAQDWGTDTKHTATDSVKTDGNMTQPGTSGNKGTDAQDWGKDSTNTSNDGVKPDGNMSQPGTSGGTDSGVKDWEQQDGQPT